MRFMLFESEKSRELHIPNMYAFGRGEFLDQTVVLLCSLRLTVRTIASQAKDALVQLLQGMILTKLSNNGIMNYEI